MALQEAIVGVWEPLRANVSRADPEKLSNRLRSEYTRLYQEQANRFTTFLGDERPFSLRATWKQREINRYADTVARGMTQTIANRRAALDKRVDTEIAEARARRAAGKTAERATAIRKRAEDDWRKWLQFKQRQLEEIIEARARLEAQTDIMVHSGLVDPASDRVMYFTGSPKPCPLCVQIQGGNPYTIEQARSIGGKAHPNCRDEWVSFQAPGRPRLPEALQKHVGEQWSIARETLDSARQRVRDGSARLWDGRPVTPAPGWAKDREVALRPLKDLWDSIPDYVERVQRKQPEIA